MILTRISESDVINENVIKCDDINVTAITEKSVRTCNAYGHVTRYKLSDYNMIDSNIKFVIAINRKGNKQIDLRNVKIIEFAPAINYLLLDMDGVEIKIDDVIEFIATRI